MSDYETIDDEADDILEFDEYDFGQFNEFDFSEFDFGEFDFSEDDSERRRRRPRRRRRLRTARRGNPTVKAPQRGYASKAELDATAKRLDGRIATNANAIKSLDGRTRATEVEIGKVGASLRKEIAIRKKQTNEIKKGLDESRQIAMMMPIISSMSKGDDKMTMMLPIMMYSGAFGGSSGSGGDANSNAMMMPLMMMAIMDGKD
ncbi:MAG: hypothetical protein ACK5NN_14825 [Sphingomonadaceae bacterium]